MAAECGHTIIGATTTTLRIAAEGAQRKSTAEAGSTGQARPRPGNERNANIDLEPNCLARRREEEEEKEEEEEGDEE